MTKSPSETVIAESSSDEKGRAIRREVRIGEEVAAVGDLIQILETDVNQLWDAWEAADREVQARLAELDGGNNLSAGKNDCVKNARQSLTEDMKAFDTEAEDIIEDSHEEARACEKVGLAPSTQIPFTPAYSICRNLAERYIVSCPLFCSSICWRTRGWWRACQTLATCPCSVQARLTRCSSMKFGGYGRYGTASGCEGDVGKFPACCPRDAGV